MRILVASNCPLQEHLGSGYVIKNFTQGLRDIGHVVDVLDPEQFDVLPILGSRFFGYRQAWGMRQAVKRALRAQTYDLVEFWGGESWLAVGLPRHERSRPLVVQHTNGPEPRYVDAAREHSGQRIRRWISARVAARAFTEVDGIVTVSHGDRDWLLSDPRFEKIRVEVVEPALPAALLNISFVERAPRRIGFCGSWLARKGTAAVTEAAVRLYREVPGFQLVLAGVGTRFSAAEVFPPDIAPRVEVHPMIYGKERLKEYYQSLSVLISPSLGESFGLVLPESMACGCVVVSSRTGFASGLHDGVDASIMAEPSAGELFRRVKELLSNPDLRNRLARAGWQRVQRMRWPTAVERLERIYDTWRAARVVVP